MFKKLLLIPAFFGITTICTAKQVDNPWLKVAAPTSSAPESIGAYDAGCLRGAQSLPKDGPGYQAMRLSRRKFFGHPALLNFLESFASRVKNKTHQDVLIGDMGLARGGPALSGHLSHQMGLDVDIWFYQPPQGKVLTIEERESLSAPSMVVPEFSGLTRNWNSQKIILLQEAALDTEVERIFVNPVIKAEVCRSYKGQEWVRKLRPWWFHEEHFHVRLKCQSGSELCKPQDPPAEGDGCGAEVASWFTQENKAKEQYMRTHFTEPVMPVLPAVCSSVLTEN